MNLWVILLIIGTLALVFGPIMMFQPSQRDRKLIALRQAAAEKGIRVRFTNLFKQALAVYSIPVEQSQQWLLIKQDLAHDIHFHQHWDWQDSTQQAPKHQHSVLREFLQQCDTSIYGVELTHTSVGLCWNETKLSIDDIERMLLALKERLC